LGTLKHPAPEWETAGIQGLQGVVHIPASRFIHVPNYAIPTHLNLGTVEGKADARPFYPELASTKGNPNIIASKPVLGTRIIRMLNPFGRSRYDKLNTIPSIAHITSQLEAQQENPELELESAPMPKAFEPGKKPSQGLGDLSSILPPKKSYTHVNESYPATPTCRFCEDASGKDGKGPIVQTGTAVDGRPLYAHEECDNPFAFAEKFRFDFEGPNPVDDDFIQTASHDWGMRWQQDARRVNRQLGISTPSKAQYVDPGIPGNTKHIENVGLPEHHTGAEIFEATDTLQKPQQTGTETQVTNLNANGDANPPR
jgi:hypothetical protein